MDRGIAATADIGRLTGCRLWDMVKVGRVLRRPRRLGGWPGVGCCTGLWMAGYCGDREYWAVGRRLLLHQIGIGFFLVDGFSHFDPSHDLVLLYYDTVIGIVYSCGSLPLSTTPECAVGRLLVLETPS